MLDAHRGASGKTPVLLHTLPDGQARMGSMTTCPPGGGGGFSHGFSRACPEPIAEARLPLL